MIPGARCEYEARSDVSEGYKYAVLGPRKDRRVEAGPGEGGEAAPPGVFGGGELGGITRWDLEEYGIVGKIGAGALRRTRVSARCRTPRRESAAGRRAGEGAGCSSVPFSSVATSPQVELFVMYAEVCRIFPTEPTLRSTQNDIELRQVSGLPSWLISGPPARRFQVISSYHHFWYLRLANP